MEFNIAVLPGDGIGPEVVAEGVRVFQSIGARFGHRFNLQYGIIGGAAIDEYGKPLADNVLEMCRKADAILLGAVGGPKWDDPRSPVRPEQGLLALRKNFELFANLRPVKVYPQLLNATSIRPEVLQGTDFIVVRELTGGLYFGKPQRRWDTSRGRRAVDTLYYTEKEVERVLRVGFELAQGRRRKLTSVDKANVLESSRLWREIAVELSKEYPAVQLEHLLVDACSMHLIRRPASFDVIVTENMFGDILTDEASVLAGSMGMLPSASLGTRRIRTDGKIIGTFGLYEPIHGSAPDIAGQSIANPLGCILSVALMLRHSFGLTQESQTIEKAVSKALENGYRTADIAEPGSSRLKTSEMADMVVRGIIGEQ